MKRWTITAEQGGERLDKFLVSKLGGMGRNRVKALIDDGRVKVNSRRVVIAKWELLENDDVEVTSFDVVERRIPRREEKVATKSVTMRHREKPRCREIPHRVEKVSKKPTITKEPIPKNYVKVHYEDRDILVVEKPPGIVVQHGSRRQREPNFVDRVRNYLKRRHRGRGAYLVPVHRLDRDTSGIMVFATSKKGENLTEQFRKHTVGRSYLAVVEGSVEKNQGTVDLPLQKGTFGHGKRVSVQRGSGGMHAVTIYSVNERYTNNSLLSLDLKTGRTHQARVHMAAIGHPLVGDKIYGKKEGTGFKRHALHSHLLSLNHPVTGKRMNFKSPLPPDMEELVDRLRSG